ncbi:MAG: hypothetical protein QOF18_786, partial [Frankiaceae bacterium]|nr:hypothetical protein [Frankiaceae bacterium]
MHVVRVVAAILGGTLVVVTTLSVMRALVIPRARPGGVSRTIDRFVDGAFRLVLRRTSDYEARDEILAGQAAFYLLTLLLVWLAAYLIGYALLL